MPSGRSRKGEGVLIKSAEMLGWALGGLEREIVQTRDRLASLTAQAARLRAQIGAGAPPARGPAASPTFAEPAVTLRRPRRRMSADARKRISEMMKKRWAERKKKVASKQ